MTREELKAHCKKQIEMCEMWAIAKGEKPCGKIYEEHKLILELLEQEPCDKCVYSTSEDCQYDDITETIPPFDDCISRQAAIDAFEGELYSLSLFEKIQNLPPAQPEIVRCKDCEYGEQDEYGRWYCRGFGCQVGDEDGNGFCSDAERKNNV